MRKIQAYLKFRQKEDMKADKVQITGRSHVGSRLEIQNEICLLEKTHTHHKPELFIDIFTSALVLFHDLPSKSKTFYVILKMLKYLTCGTKGVEVAWWRSVGLAFSGQGPKIGAGAR